ncbi:MAG: hypothetical protein AABX93_03745 [Nanoarchaeota archaeon]
MPPIIEVTDEVLKGLDQLKISYTRAARQNTFPRLKQDFVYIPSAKLHFAKQKILLEKDWHETHQTLGEEGLAMPTPSEFSQTLKYLRDNPNPENTELYNEIIQIRNPWRAIWIDAFFEKRKDGLYILTENETKAEMLDKNTLIKDERISLDSWLDNPTSQGLPRKDVARGNFYFWSPRENSVAGFGTVGDDAYLYCGRDPSVRYSGLGVHAVRRE